MTTVLYLCDSVSCRIEEYLLSSEDTLPHLAPRELTLGQFSRGSHTDAVWTDFRLLYAYDRLRSAWGERLSGSGGFRRLYDGGIPEQSARYAGLALNVRTEPQKLASLQKTALSLGVFSRVAPLYLTPAWLHLEVRIAPPALPGGGYPALYPGAAGAYVFLLQDALLLTGDHRGALTGRMDAATLEAAARFRQRSGLPQFPYISGLFWKELFSALRRSEK